MTVSYDGCRPPATISSGPILAAQVSITSINATAASTPATAVIEARVAARGSPDSDMRPNLVLDSPSGRVRRGRSPITA